MRGGSGRGGAAAQRAAAPSAAQAGLAPSLRSPAVRSARSPDGSPRRLQFSDDRDTRDTEAAEVVTLSPQQRGRARHAAAPPEAPAQAQAKPTTLGLANLVMEFAQSAGGPSMPEVSKHWEHLKDLARQRKLITNVLLVRERAVDEACEREDKMRVFWRDQDRRLRQHIAELHDRVCAAETDAALLKQSAAASDLRAEELALRLRDMQDRDDRNEASLRAQCHLLEVRLARAGARITSLRMLAQARFRQLRELAHAAAAAQQAARAEITGAFDRFNSWLNFQAVWVWGKAQLAMQEASKSGGSIDSGALGDINLRLASTVDVLLNGVNGLIRQYQLEQRFGDMAHALPMVDHAGAIKARRARSIAEREERERLEPAGASEGKKKEDEEAEERRRTFDDLSAVVQACAARCNTMATVVAIGRGVDELRPLRAAVAEKEEAMRHDYAAALADFQSWAATQHQGFQSSAPKVRTLADAVALYRARIDELTAASGHGIDHADDLLGRAEGLRGRALPCLLKRARLRVQFMMLRRKLLAANPVPFRKCPGSARKRADTARRRTGKGDPGNRKSRPTLGPSTSRVFTTTQSSGWLDQGWGSSDAPGPERQNHGGGFGGTGMYIDFEFGGVKQKKKKPKRRAIGTASPLRQLVSSYAQTEDPYGACGACGAALLCLDCSNPARLDMLLPPHAMVLLRHHQKQLADATAEYAEVMRQQTLVVREMMSHLQDLYAEESDSSEADLQDTGAQDRLQGLLRSLDESPSQRLLGADSGAPQIAPQPQQPSLPAAVPPVAPAPMLPTTLPVLCGMQNRLLRARWEEQLRTEIAREQRRRQALRELTGEDWDHRRMWEEAKAETARGRGAPSALAMLWGNGPWVDDEAPVAKLAAADATAAVDAQQPRPPVAPQPSRKNISSRGTARTWKRQSGVHLPGVIDSRPPSGSPRWRADEQCQVDATALRPAARPQPRVEHSGSGSPRGQPRGPQRRNSLR